MKKIELEFHKLEEKEPGDGCMVLLETKAGLIPAKAYIFKSTGPKFRRVTTSGVYGSAYINKDSIISWSFLFSY